MQGNANIIVDTRVTCSEEGGTIHVEANNAVGSSVSFNVVITKLGTGESYSTISGSSFTDSIPNLPNGEYKLEAITTENEIFMLRNEIVECELPILLVSVETIKESAAGKMDGKAIISVNGGLAPHFYRLKGTTTWLNSEVFIDLIPGEYVVEVKDSGKLLGSAEFTILAGAQTYTATRDYTATCGKNYSGSPVKATKTATSTISETDAATKALAAAKAEAGALLVCEVALEFEDLKLEEASYTLSYSVDGEFWCFEHDYIPSMMLFTDTQLCSFDKGKLYRHNVKGVKCKFYDGTIYDDSIEVPFSPGGDISKLLHSINWNTEVEKDGATLHDSTFDEVLIYNNEMCSGYIVPTNFKGLRDAEGTWRFNKFKNKVVNRNLPIMINNEPNLANLSSKRAWFKDDVFIGKYFIVRYNHRNNQQNNLYIYNVDCIVRKSDR